ncbi:MAG: CRTAC1 family protein [Verrucomicrobiales bacterium]|nr:CRTAC1 family protein [Verrucomicrobiales bacterium]
MKALRPTRRLWLLLALLGAVAWGAWWWRRPADVPDRRAQLAAAERLLPQLLALEERERRAAETVWVPEYLAQRCGRVIEQLWDGIHAASNRWVPLRAVAFLEILLPRWADPELLPHGIRLLQPRADTGNGPPDSGGQAWSNAAWSDWLRGLEAAGWRLDQVEFRHERFEVDENGHPRRSEFAVRAHLTRHKPESRAALEGRLGVEWVPSGSNGEPPGLGRLDARRFTLALRDGPPGFRRVLHETIRPPARTHFIDPLILHDLSGDGRPEIVLASRNRVYSWRAGNRFEVTELCRPPLPQLFTGLLADFDGDGRDDFLGVRLDGVYLVPGTAAGGFDGPAREVWPAPERIRYGQALTCGDVDGDGDLDVWLGQYKNPYDGGQMPTPYYDANDGYPAYLLLNDGGGRFSDATESAGLAAKRWRRTYAASLVDLDGDGDLDLAVVSDFAGVEVYANDGRGRFEERTAAWVGDPRAFGMAHTFADFNRDGRLDWFVTGMHCPTASRLVHLGLARPERPDYLAMAPAMIAGNKLLLAGADGRFRNVAAEVGVARSGWSWGCAAADVDNDGWPDLAIANGHETRASVVEYEPEFWLHDVYAADSKESPVAATYFAAKINRLRGSGHSYGGWEQNRLFLNRRGAGFVEVAHLLGVALTEDSRNLAMTDLDGDGRVDLVLTTFEVWPERRQTLQVFRNELPETGHWLEVRLRAGARGGPVVGAQLTVRLPDGTALIRRVIGGDSHRGQHPTVLHFGLGSAEAVESVEVRWPRGGRTAVPGPPVNAALELRTPAD